MSRKRFFWKLPQTELQLGERTLIAGVLNITPDSFSDGGRFQDTDVAYAHALQLEEHGADIVDIGAESTRPGSKPISEEEELRRLIPVLKRLRNKLSVPISVDTYKSGVAERALDLGAQIINDPMGLTADPLLAKSAAKYNAALILNHTRGKPETWAKQAPLQDPMATVLRDLEAAVNRARHSGCEPASIALDPGLGFGKRKEESVLLISGLALMQQLNLPLHLGPSRKSFLAQATPEDALMATAAAVTACILNGAHIVRVHDVARMRPVVQVADTLVRAQ